MAGTVKYDTCPKQGDGKITPKWGLSTEMTYEINHTLTWGSSQTPSPTQQLASQLESGNSRICGLPGEAGQIQVTGTQVPGMWVFRRVIQNTVILKHGIPEISHPPCIADSELRGKRWTELGTGSC